MDEVNDWQKNYKEEARQIIRNSKEEYQEGIRQSNLIGSGFCEVGVHQTKLKIHFCRNCKRSFCAEHGYADKHTCKECFELEI